MNPYTTIEPEELYSQLNWKVKGKEIYNAMWKVRKISQISLPYFIYTEKYKVPPFIDINLENELNAIVLETALMLRVTLHNYTPRKFNVNGECNKDFFRTSLMHDAFNILDSHLIEDNFTGLSPIVAAPVPKVYKPIQCDEIEI